MLDEALLVFFWLFSFAAVRDAAFGGVADFFLEADDEALGAVFLSLSSALGSTDFVLFGAEADFWDVAGFLFPDEGEAFGGAFLALSSALGSGASSTFEAVAVGVIEPASPCRTERISEPNNGSSINVSREVSLTLIWLACSSSSVSICS